MRTGFTFFVLLLFITGFSHRSAAQSVVADQFVESSTDWVNPARVTDGDPQTYTYVSSLLHLLKTSYLQVSFPQMGKAGDIIEINVSATGQTLGLDLLTNAQLKVYDDKGNLLETINKNALIHLALLSGDQEVYQIRYLTDVHSSYRFKQVRIEFQELLAVNLLDEFRVHQIAYTSTCPPVSATSVYAFKEAAALSPSRVLNPAHAVDGILSSYATLEVPLNLLGIFPPAYLDLDFGSQRPRSGDFVGFALSEASTLLSLSLLSNIEIQVYDQQNNLRETRDGFSLLDLKLLSGTTDIYTLGFVTKDEGYTIARARIILKGLVNVLQSLRVHHAFHFSLDRPKVSVKADGPTQFCQGGSVTLSLVNPSQFASWKWSSGETSPSIKVTKSGNYTVTVTNALGCTATSLPIAVTVSSDHQPELKATLTHNSCYGAAQGAIQITVSGGSGQYEYDWAHGPKTRDVSGLKAGGYSLKLRDKVNGCQRTDSFQIQQPDSLQAIFEILGDDSCTVEKDGSIEVSLTGGTAPYTLWWSTGDSTRRIQGLDTGRYVLEVKDAKGCRDIWEAIVRRSDCRDTSQGGGGDDDDDDPDDDHPDDDDNPAGPGQDGLVIYEVITPNGDGANDTWEIRGLDRFPGSSIKVFNKWGDQVFDSKDYRNDWGGTRTNGEPLADGTYFYLIQIPARSSGQEGKTYTGSLLIQR